MLAQYMLSLSVCLSVYPIDRPQQWRAMGLLLSAPQTGISIDSGGGPAATAPQHGVAAANAGSVTFAAAVAG